MIALAIVTAYCLCGAVSGWIGASLWYWDNPHDYDRAPIMGMLFFGGLLFWPVALPLILMHNKPESFLYKPKKVRLEIYQRRIKELEREVGIR